jgi:hypothetical protein
MSAPTARCDSLDAHDVALGLYGGSPEYANRLIDARAQCWLRTSEPG